MAQTSKNPAANSNPINVPDRTRFLVWEVAAVLVLVGLGACGGSDNNGAGSDDFDVDSVIEDALGGTDDSDDPDAADDADVVLPEQSNKSGLATLIIAGQTYEFFAEGCTAENSGAIGATTDFGISGTSTIDGQPFGGLVQRDVWDIDGDGTDDVLHTIKIEVGREDVLRQAEPGNASLWVSLSETDEGDLGVIYEPGRISGSGTINDRNGVLAGGNDDIPFTFVATCV